MSNKTSYKKGGYVKKYDIVKTDGSPMNPDADYFVLRLDKDPCALEALKTYKKEVSKHNSEFAQDIDLILKKYS